MKYLNCFLISSFFLVFSNVSFTQVEFGEMHVYGDITNMFVEMACDVQILDLNGNGGLDVLVSGLIVSEEETNTFNYNFFPQMNYNPLGDFDMDGDFDAVGLMTDINGFNKMVAWLNDGNSTFTESEMIFGQDSLHFQSFSTLGYVADLNEDGIADFIYSFSGTDASNNDEAISSLQFVINDGMGNFSAPEILDLSTNTF